MKPETFQLQLLNGNSPIVYYACIENCQANSKLGKVGKFRQVKLNFFLWKKKVWEKVWTTTNSLSWLWLQARPLLGSGPNCMVEIRQEFFFDHERLF